MSDSAKTREDFFFLNTSIRQKDQFDLNEWWGLGCMYVCSYVDSVLGLAGCWCWHRFNSPVRQVNFFRELTFSAGSPQCSYSPWLQLDAFTSVQHWYVCHDLDTQKYNTHWECGCPGHIIIIKKIFLVLMCPLLEVWCELYKPVAGNQPTRELISTHITQTQQQRPESLMATPTWHTS